MAQAGRVDHQVGWTAFFLIQFQRPDQKEVGGVVHLLLLPERERYRERGLHGRRSDSGSHRVCAGEE